jgi:UBX domain-containing protein 1
VSRTDPVDSRNGPTEPTPSASSSTSFRGQGNTLGTDEPQTEAPSAPPAPTGLLAGLLGRLAPSESDPEPVTRNLTFWSNGFSIEDGPLHLYDAPGNKELLEAIQAGRAPLSLFGVKFNQPLQLVVAQRTTEDYVQPPKVSKPFEGGGNRLGSPAPVVASQPPPAVREFKVDENKPTTSIQVRLGDGTRWVFCLLR